MPKISGFDQLLLLLDPIREEAGEKYEKLRLRLLRFFLWQNLENSEELADVTLDRIAKKLEEGEQIQDLINYLYGVARNIAHEEKLRLQKNRKIADHLQWQSSLPVTPGQRIKEQKEAIRLECLEHCLEKLMASERRLILRYYQKEKGEKIWNRKKVADDLKIPMNALRLRVFRIRLKLEKCLRDCMVRMEKDS